MKYMTKKETVRGVEYKYSSEWISDLESEEHWRLYWNQQKLMQNKIINGDNVLEIGVGSGFTASYLKSKGFNVVTLDIDSEKKPDIVGNLVEYKFSKSYDHILAFEVFEHIPFIEFKSVVGKLSAICNKYIFLSVPINERVLFDLDCQLPILGKRALRFAFLKRKVTDTNHFWEIGDGSVTINDFESELIKGKLTILTKVKRFSRLFYALRIN